MHMAGSLLPSESRETMAPLAWGTRTFQVVAVQALETYVLTLSHERGTSRLAEHPNSYSLHALAKRLVSGDHAHALAQRDYIEACGGMARPESTFRYFLDN